MALTFPSNLASLSGTRPVVSFSCDGPQPTTINLPIPQSLSFEDSATYDNTELGYLGASLSQTAGAANSSSSLGEFGNKLGSIASSKWDALAGEMKSMSNIIAGISGVGGAVASRFGADTSKLTSAVGIGTGTTSNKNITTEFTNVGTRNFAFAFKMIAETQSEATSIANIVKAFRTNLYPEGDISNLFLKYPPKWKIKFLSGAGGGLSELSNLPKIFDVYLTSCNSTYNSSGNLWRTDGSPLETDLTVSFTETRANNRADFSKLNNYIGDFPGFPGSRNIS
jgi:hypothetical protein